MIEDIDMWRAAKLLVDRHRNEAPVHAAMRADEPPVECDRERLLAWNLTPRNDKKVLRDGWRNAIHYASSMAYHELNLLEGTAEEARNLIREQIRPFLVDVHTMLRLPMEDLGLPGGCNLSSALVLLSAVAGVSTQLYRDSSLDPKEQGGERFKRVLSNFFPWCEEPKTPSAITGRHAAEILYDAYRNPLAHSVGIYDGPYLGTLKVEKGPLSEDQIEAIERATLRPTEWIRPTLETDSPSKASRTKTVLTVKCFYWGVRIMIREVVNRQWVGAEASTMGVPETSSSISVTARAAFTKVTSGSTESDQL